MSSHRERAATRAAPGAARPAAAQEFDLVVVGGGVAGLTAALVGVIEGGSVLLLEKTATVGGTSARSSGTVWIPGSSYLRQAGVEDDTALARQYLDALVGEKAEPALREAYLREGPEMLEYLDAHTDIRFRPYAVQPDYRQDLPGAAIGGRALEPLPFDGRALGRDFDRIAWPLPELMLFGGMMVTRGEVNRLLKLGRSWDAIGLGASLVLRYAADRLRFRRGTRLVLGNALVARLFKHLVDRHVPTWFSCTVLRLEREGHSASHGASHGASDSATHRATALIVRHEGAEVTVRARRGIVLAGGGFPANPELRERYLPSPTPQHTPAAEACTGDLIALGQQAGAALGRVQEDNGLWFPSSIAKRADGTTAVYPHIVLDRAKPGLIAINAAGRRFVDEAVSYHDFTRAMFRANREVPCIPAQLVCDRRFVWTYGLGLIRPRTLSLARYVRSGYLTVADTLPELARRIGVDPDGLADTVRRHNEYARSGTDPDFGKGSSDYDRAYGDAEHGPNPCLGPIERPPFCAVPVVPTPLATSLGLRTDGDGQVLDAQGQPVAGLYACGNDMDSPFGGEYPGAGAQLGLAMTFGYTAARHAFRAG